MPNKVSQEQHNRNASHHNTSLQQAEITKQQRFVKAMKMVSEEMFRPQTGNKEESRKKMASADVEEMNYRL